MRLKLLTGDIIKHQGKRMKLSVSGVDVDSEFKDNSLLLNAHKHSNEDVYGRWINLERNDNEISAEAEFDSMDETAIKIKNKVEQGYIKGVSAGLKIEKYHFEEDLLVIDESILYEASLTPLPANKHTLNLTYKNKEFKMNDKKESQELILTLSEEIKNDSIVIAPIEEAVKDAVIELAQEPILELNYKELFDNLELNFNEITLKLNEKDSIILNLTQKVEEFESLLRENEIKEHKELVKLSISEGKFEQEQEEILMKLSLDVFKELYATAKSKTVKQPSVSFSKLAKETTSTNERDSWSFGDWVKNDYIGLNLMKEQSPETYQDLYNAYYKKTKNN